MGVSMSSQGRYEREAGRKARADTDVMREAEVNTRHFEEGRGGHKPRNVGTNRSQRRQENRSPPTKLLEEMQPCRHVDFRLLTPGTARINSPSFDPQSHGRLLTAAMGN